MNVSQVLCCVCEVRGKTRKRDETDISARLPDLDRSIFTRQPLSDNFYFQISPSSFIFISYTWTSAFQFRKERRYDKFCNIGLPISSQSKPRSIENLDPSSLEYSIYIFTTQHEDMLLYYRDDAMDHFSTQFSYRILGVS